MFVNDLFLFLGIWIFRLIYHSFLLLRVCVCVCFFPSVLFLLSSYDRLDVVCFRRVKKKVFFFACRSPSRCRCYTRCECARVYYRRRSCRSTEENEREKEGRKANKNLSTNKTSAHTHFIVNVIVSFLPPSPCYRLVET